MEFTTERVPIDKWVLYFSYACIRIGVRIFEDFILKHVIYICLFIQKPRKDSFKIPFETCYD